MTVEVIDPFFCTATTAVSFTIFNDGSGNGWTGYTAYDGTHPEVNLTWDDSATCTIDLPSYLGCDGFVTCNIPGFFTEVSFQCEPFEAVYDFGAGPGTCGNWLITITE